MIKIKIRRPLMLICLVWLLTLMGVFAVRNIFQQNIRLIGYCAAALVIILSGTVICFRFRKTGQNGKHIIYLLILLIIMTAAYFRAERICKRESAFSELEGTCITYSGVVENLTYVTDYSAGMKIRIESLNGRKVSGNMIVNAEIPVYAAVGEKIAGTAVVDISDWDEDEKMNYFSKGFLGEITITKEDTFQANGEKKHDIITFCKETAYKCRISAGEYLSKRDAGVVCGILLGDKSELDSDIKRDFRRVGISHVLAVSGLHLSILFGMAEMLFRKLYIGKRIRLLLLFLFLLLFMGITGFPLSLVRAGIMWMMTAAAFFLGDTNDSVTALFLSAACITVVTPEAVFDVGLLLSVSATLGILILGAPTLTAIFEKLPGRLRTPLTAVLSPVILSVTATMFTFPVTALVFGEISVIGPLANLLVQLPVSAILCLAPFLILAGFLPVSMPAKLLASALHVLITAVVKAVSILASGRNVLIGVRYPFLLPVLLLFVIVSAIFLYKFKKPAILYLSYAICAVLFFGCIAVYKSEERGKVYLAYTTSGKNDCLTLVSDGKGMLFDCSDGSHNAAYLASTMLSDQNIPEIETVVLTHYHLKHVSTLARLAGETVIRTLWLPEPENEEETEIAELLRETLTGIEISEYRRGGDTMTFAGAEIKFLPREELSRSVQPLVAFSVRDGNGTEALYLGSAAWESSEEAYLDRISEALSSAEVLIIGVHGPTVKKPFEYKDSSFALSVSSGELPGGFSGNAVTVNEKGLLIIPMSDYCQN